MADFFIMVARFFAALWRSIKREPEARAVFIFVILILLSGTIFFVEVEHWQWLDALYFCVTTLTTVGSGDFMPHTEIGKIFTIIYIFMGIGAVLAAARIIATHAVAQATESPFKKFRDTFTKKQD
jgi:hypothetical protein